MAPSTRAYGQITGLETLGLFGALLVLPFAQALRLLRKPFVQHDKVRTWRRVKADAVVGLFSASLNAYQIQFVDKSSQKVYEKWAPTVGVKQDVEAIEEGAQLLWVTPRKRKRVVLYVHGGGYVLPAVPFGYTYWKLVGDELNKGGEDYSVAFLEYGLIPKVEFPTFVKQAIASIKHLIASGYQPEDILLTGDSAGATIIILVLEHILHPIPGVPEFLLPSQLGPAVFISPYAVLKVESPSFFSNAKTDIFSLAFFQHLEQVVVPLIPKDQLVYLQPSRAPKGWFDGVDKLVSRVLITVGEGECLKDDIDSFSKAFSAAHRQTTLFSIPNGTHNEPYGTLVAAEPEVGEWPSKVAKWLVEGTA
ncbi:Alpha/Beta hydrolase protein [Gymnopilus junonius]|uniref:Alpha/Beta hydrolase protein n=1 Tax=Gymnopilus junonius TaxID=109634 RepID=A0A9P5NPM4_GYMJU|nr:Alpha/Beta hydrolase protein [Gymnopilus junonius]